MLIEFLGWIILLFPLFAVIYLVFDLIKINSKNKKDCDISIGKQKELNDLLFQAISNGDVKKTEEAIIAGANVNVRGLGGKTPLIRITHRAADAKYYNDEANINIAKLLVEKGIDINIKDLFGKRAVEYCDWALPGFMVQIIELLQKNGTQGFPRNSQKDVSGL